MSLAVNAQGTLFKVNSTASPAAYTTIPEVKEVNSPNVKTDLNDVTSHDSSGGFREFLPGLHDGDSVTAPINWVPINTVHIAVRTDAYASTLRGFQTVFPGGVGATVTYNGYYVNFQGDAKIGQPLTASISVKVTGLPVWT